jgi:hypothetical protein
MSDELPNHLLYAIGFICEMGRASLEEGQGTLIGRVVGEREFRLGGFGLLRPDLRDVPVRLGEFGQFPSVLRFLGLLRLPVHQGRQLHVLTWAYQPLCVRADSRRSGCPT